jgi:Trypsin-like peptidase domain
MNVACSRVVIFSLILAAAETAGAQDCVKRQDYLTSLGARLVTGERFSSGKLTLRTPPIPGTRYLRLLVSVKSPRICPWYITVRDEQLHLLETFGPDDFATTTSRWTIRIPEETVFLDLQPCADSSMPDAGYDEVISMPTEAQRPYYSAKDPLHPGWKPLYSASVLTDKTLGDSVGFLTAMEKTAAGVATWTCSGIIIAPNLFMTNWHCGGIEGAGGMWTAEIMHNMMVDTSWDDDLFSREYDVAGLAVHPNENLDFAILRLKPINYSGPARPAILASKNLSDPHLTRTAVSIIHHPLALRKQVTETCSILNTNVKSWRGGLKDTEFGHDCDTEGGSSGGPVFNGEGQVIGLHHRPYDYNERCESDGMNKAVKMRDILEFLKINNPDIYGQLTVVP